MRVRFDIVHRIHGCAQLRLSCEPTHHHHACLVHGQSAWANTPRNYDGSSSRCYCYKKASVHPSNGAQQQFLHFLSQSPASRFILIMLSSYHFTFLTFAVFLISYTTALPNVVPKSVGSECSVLPSSLSASSGIGSRFYLQAVSAENATINGSASVPSIALYI